MFRILVAEDDKGTRRLMQDTLADAGYEPLPAADGQQALELLGQKHVDLMVLDVMMPSWTGFRFCRSCAAPAATFRYWC